MHSCRWSGRVWGFLAGLNVLAACSGSPAVSEIALSPDGCDAKPLPGRLPAVSQVVDSAFLARDVSSVGFAAQGRVLVITVTYGFDGTASAAATASELGDTQTETVVSRVQAQLRDRRLRDPTAVRLRIHAGPNPTIAVEQAAYCEPELEVASLRGRRQNVTVVDRAAVRRAFRRATGFRVRIAISETGAVMAVTDAQTRVSLWGIVYDEIVEWRFRPATADGVAMPSFLDYEAWQLGRLADRIR